MSEQPPTISTVINNHNYGRFIGQAIDSVLAQRCPAERVELIVVDDGSTDGSRRVIESFAGRVKPVFLEHGGQAAAINAGVQAAQGGIVCLLDSDDWWREDKLARVIERFRGEPDLGMVQHWCLEVDSALRPVAGRMPQAPAVFRLQDFLEGGTCFAGTTGLCFRRDILRAVGPIPAGLTFCADEYLYTHAIFFAPVGTIIEPLAWRRVHGANLYAGLYSDPRRLADRLRVRAILDSELAVLMCSRGSAFAPGEARRRRAEILQEELFLHRYRGEVARAWACWRELGRNVGGGYRWFKQATLLLALAAPALYSWALGLYVRCQVLVDLRRWILRQR
jgi:glycosyltransferase involved in cell wall biosynthesis